MLPLILVAVGAYLIGDSVLEDKKYAKGGQLDAKSAKKRLEQLRKELRAERISYSELAELESLKEYIDKDDVELLEAAGVPEHDDDDDDDKYAKGGKTQGYDDKEDERLAMEHGKMSKKDLDSTHARRDDAQFEERGKMAKGGTIDVEDIKNKMYGYFKAWLGNYISDEELVNSLKRKLGTKYFRFFKGDPMVNDWRSVENSLKTRNNRGFLKENMEISLEEKSLEIYNSKNEKLAKGGKLVGKQKKLDVNKNGKLDAEDFKMLRGEKMAKGGAVKRPYKLGDMWRTDFDYEGMLKQGLKSKASWGEAKLQKLFDSFEDVNYHTAGAPLWDAIKSLENGNNEEAEKHIEEFHKRVKSEMDGIDFDLKKGGKIVRGEKMAKGGLAKHAYFSNAEIKEILIKDFEASGHTNPEMKNFTKELKNKNNFQKLAKDGGFQYNKEQKKWEIDDETRKYHGKNINDVEEYLKSGW